MAVVTVSRSLCGREWMRSSGQISRISGFPRQCGPGKSWGKILKLAGTPCPLSVRHLQSREHILMSPLSLLRTHANVPVE